MSVPLKKMELRCYVAIFVFAALATVLGYMVCHRLKAVTASAPKVTSHVNVPRPVASAPLLPKAT